MEGKCRRGGAEKKEIEGGCRKRKWEGINESKKM
jgi:hypothetical protein